MIYPNPHHRNWFAIASFFVLSLVVTICPAEEPWRNGQKAERVWGQADFVSSVQGQSNQQVNVPDSIVADPITGKVFVSDAGNHRVLRFASFAALESGAPAEAVLGQSGFDSVVAAGTRSRMNNPKGLSIDADGRLWVADANNHRVLRFDAASSKVSGANADGVLGQPNFTTTEIAAGAAGMGYVAGVLADASGRLWVSDWDNRRVTRFDAAAGKSDGADADAVLGQPDFETNEEATTQASLKSPAGLAMDASGNLWIADIFQARVVRFADAANKPNGAGADQVLGQLEFTTANMNQTSWGLSWPSGLAIGSDGTLWVTDQLFHRILRYESPALSGDGPSATNVLGQPGFESADWGTSQERFNTPEGVCIDADGEIWVADRENHRLLKFGRSRFQPDGLVGPKRSEMQGNDLYTKNGSGQEIELTIAGGRSGKFFFNAQNDGNVADDLLVKATRKNRRAAVKYFRTTKPRENVTGKITRAGYLIPDLKAGKVIRFKGKVSGTEMSLSRSVTKTLKVLTSSESSGAKDKAKVKVTTKP